MKPGALLNDVVEGCANGERVVISRETFWYVEWENDKKILDNIGAWLAEARNHHGIGHMVVFHGYEFFKVEEPQ